MLLVKNLPVPLHVSTKADWSVMHTDAFDWDSEKSIKFDMGNFPQRYRDNPYWIPNGVCYLGISSEFQELSAGLAQCMREGDGRDARNKLATEHGWRLLEQKQKGVESWEHEDTGDRIDYYTKRAALNQMFT